MWMDIKITIVGMQEVLIENYTGIVSYNDEFLEVRSKQQRVSIYGKHLFIKYYTKDEMLLSGRILKIECKECDF